MRQLAYVPDQLREIPMSAGHLPDYCLVMCASENTDGRIHSYNDFPLLISGRVGGCLLGDIHHRASTNPSITQGVLTALRAGDVEIEDFGSEGGYTLESIITLEAYARFH